MKVLISIITLVASPLFGASLAAVLQPIVFEQPIVKTVRQEVPIESIPIDAPVTPCVAQVEAEKEEDLQYPLACEAFIAGLEKSLEERYHTEGQLKVKLLSTWPCPLLKGHDWSIELMDAPRNFAKRMVVGVNIHCAGEQVGPFRLSLNCECWQECYIAKERITGRFQLLASDFEVHALDILSYPQAVVPASVELSDYQLSQGILANRPLFWRDIARRPTVKKGKIVNAVAQEGLLTISMKGEVLTPGFTGDFVTVRNLQTRKEFQGRVKNEDTIEVYF